MKTFTKFLCASVLAFSATAFADVSSAKPIRVGPVQNYGALGTSGSKIISLKNNKQVVLQLVCHSFLLFIICRFHLCQYCVIF